MAFVRGNHRWPLDSPQRASNAENVSLNLNEILGKEFFKFDGRKHRL